jgi:hypothetical protein
MSTPNRAAKMLGHLLKNNGVEQRMDVLVHMMLLDLLYG